jgi:predicted porin
MKKSLVALAALAVAGVASAQSSVTLFGVVDAAVAGYNNKAGYVPTGTNLFFAPQGNVSVKGWGLTNSGYNSSRLGFRGTEDLGGGLAASFWLEAGLGNDDGSTGGNVSNTTPSVTGFFNRRSTVSLSGGFGELRLGRDYTPTFWNDTVFDPFGTNGVGTNLISIANGYQGGVPNTSGFTQNNMYVRASNSVGYFLPPNLGGFYGQVMYAFSEKPKYEGNVNYGLGYDSRSGTYMGGRFGYANGPLDIAAAYGEATLATPGVAAGSVAAGAFAPYSVFALNNPYLGGITTKLKTANVGASYDFGVVKLFGEYSQTKLAIDNSGLTAVGNINADPQAKGWLLGATVPIGAGLIQIAYSGVKYDLNRPLVLANQFGFTAGDPRADKIALGYVYNLSKRTAVYTTVAYLRDKDGADLTNGGPVVGAGTLTSTGAAAIANTNLQMKNSTAYQVGIRHAF